MKRMLVSLVALATLIVVGQAYATGANQKTSIEAIAAGVVMPINDNGGTVTVDSTNLDVRDLSSSQDTVGAVQSGIWIVATVTTITNVVHVDDNGGALTVDSVNLDIRDLVSSTDSIAAVQSGNWVIQSITNTVTVTATDLDIRNLGYAADSVKIYGSEGVPVKTDATGQIYAVTSAASVDAIEKAYTFSNIATGSWVEIGSYTVTTAKSLKIDGAKLTAGYDIEVKISDGTTGDEVYLQTAPASPSDDVTITHPGAKVAATIIRVYAKASEATNAGVIRVMGFEYTP